MIATPGKWGMVVYDGEVNRSMSNICQMKCQNPENMKRRIEIGEDREQGALAESDERKS